MVYREDKMKISILQQDLSPPLQAVSRSIGVRSQLPVLDNVLLSVEGSKLKLAATNLEIGVIKYVSVEVISSGEITVPAKTLLEIISGLGPTRIDIEAEGEVLTIKSGKFKATINGIAASEFPAIPVSEGEGVDFDKSAFLESQQILFASAVDEGRPVLTGVLTESSQGKLDFVATDGFRLAHRRVKLETDADSFKSLIPRRTFEEVIRIISEEDLSEEEKVNLSSSKGQNQIIFTVGQTIVSSRLIEGQFPSWEKIIPTEIKTRVTLEKEQMMKALKLAAVFAKNEANVITLTSQEGKLGLKSQAKELGSQENEIDSQIEGDPIQIAFNAKFLTDAISSCPSAQIMIEFSGPLSACLIKPIGIEGLEYIVMPVRLS